MASKNRSDQKRTNVAEISDQIAAAYRQKSDQMYGDLLDVSWKIIEEAEYLRRTANRLQYEARKLRKDSAKLQYLRDNPLRFIFNAVLRRTPFKRWAASFPMPEVEPSEPTTGILPYKKVISLHRQAYTALPSKVRAHAGTRTSSAPILYLLHNCRPYHNGGYAVRAHGIVKGLRAHGHEVVPFARPGYPHDSVTGINGEIASQSVDGVDYRYFGRSAANRKTMTRDQYADAYFHELSELVEQTNPALIHAASFHHNAHAALRVKEKYGIPVIYEVRGLSILTDFSKPHQPGDSLTDRLFPSKARFWEFREEIELAKRVDHLLCITQASAELFASLGVDSDKITIFPNGADKALVDRPMRASAPDGPFVIGYIGSIQRYEGLDVLIDAIEILAQKRPDLDIRALVVGDGPYAMGFRAKLDKSPHREKFVVHPRVPHEEIEQYYQQCSVMAYPRLPLPVSEVISPIKPFEAMARGIPVISSNVAALAEIVKDGVTGFTFEAGSAKNLADLIERLATDMASADLVCAQAKTFVQEERNWEAITAPISDLYRKLTC